MAPVQLFKLFIATTPAGGTVRSFALQLSRSCLSSRVPRSHAFRRNLGVPFIFVVSASSHSHAQRDFLAAEFSSSRSLRARLATIVVRSWCDRNKMAAAAAAALLDELMGRNRNVLPNEKPKELNWEDPEVSPSSDAKCAPFEHLRLFFAQNFSSPPPLLTLYFDENIFFYSSSPLELKTRVIKDTYEGEKSFPSRYKCQGLIVSFIRFL